MKNLIHFKIALLLCLVTLAFGFGLGITFGVAEDTLKGHLASQGQAVLDTVYGGDEAAMNKVVRKSWVYFKRAHLHANGLGTSGLVMVLLIAALPGGRMRWRWLTATALGLGGLVYSVYWLLAGLKAPGLGSTHAAKESLDWVAIPGAGLCVLGLVSVIVLVAFGLGKLDSDGAESVDRA
ncbi:MAG: hypothetical protein V3V20_01810 [Algisphaera sp.]